jgi:hypothetical protein
MVIDLSNMQYLLMKNYSATEKTTLQLYKNVHLFLHLLWWLRIWNMKFCTKIIVNIYINDAKYYTVSAFEINHVTFLNVSVNNSHHLQE